MPDEKVQTAIANWAPRFITQGVDYNDFFCTTARIERWDDWCREWCVTGDVHTNLAAKAQAKGNLTSAGEAYITAALCYHFGKYLFQDHQAEYMAAARKSIDAYAKGSRLLDSTAERVEIPLGDSMMVGIFRRPLQHSRPSPQEKGTEVRSPLILLLPGLDSTKEEFFYWENVFLRRGLATFSLDGPGQGECGFHSNIRPDYEVTVSAVLDVLTKRAEVDPRRIGVAGVSLGGYYAVRAAAFDPRVKATVENCGTWNMGESWDMRPSLTRAAFQYHSGAKDDAEAKTLAYGISLDGVAQKVRQPLLVIQGKLDRIVPWEHGQKIANAVGSNAEFILFENGNHVCNNIPYLYRPLTADWLKEKLG